jgi:ankyrin repeat protein
MDVQANVDDEVRAFIQASVGGRPGRALRMLLADPAIANRGYAAALVLGYVDRVRAEIQRDPGGATRPDPASGWTPLHVVAASRWHALDPDRAPGLLATARLLLDSGADMEAGIGGGGRTVLQCATASASTSAGNLAVLRLLLERGAIPGDHDLYLAGFAANGHECLRLLLDHLPDVAGTVEQALAAPISAADVEGCRLLLEAGADPNRYRDDDGRPCPIVATVVQGGGPVALVELLLDHGADPDQPGPDGRTPYQLALREGRPELAAVLRAHGARDDVSDVDAFLGACMAGSETEARALLAARPDLLDRLDEAGTGRALALAAETGRTATLRLMLDLGLPVDARGGDPTATALHAAAYAGSAEAVALLAERGADLEARDGQWNSTPLEWAAVGSGERPERHPHPDWVAAVRALLAAGATAAAVDLSPDGPKQPSPEVAELLRR